MGFGGWGFRFVFDLGVIKASCFRLLSRWGFGFELFGGGIDDVRMVCGGWDS